MLLIVSIILALGAVHHIAAAATPPANPTCGDSRILPCLLVPITYLMVNPQGMAIIKKMANRSEDALPTQDELNIVCQLQSTAVDCIGAFINECTASIPNAANFHEFVSGTIAVARAVCARPDLLNDVKLAVECMNQSEAKFANNSCADKSGDLDNPFECFNTSTFEFDPTGLDFTSFRTYFHENDVLGSLCCSMDKFRNCAKQDLTGTCSPQADAIIKDIFQLLDTSFSCSGRMAGCSTASQRIRTEKNGCRLRTNYSEK